MRRSCCPSRTEFCSRFLKAYLLKKEDYDSYREYLNREGFDVLKNLCEKYSYVPAYDEDNRYYTDFGAKKRLSLDEIGTAECSAGLFDMIGVDRKFIKGKTRSLLSLDDSEEIKETLYTILLASSRMLLVTRGLDPKNDKEIFQCFKKHFITAGLIDTKYIDIVILGERNEKDNLEKQKESILALSQDVNNLYKSMDDSLRFKTERVTS